MKTPLQTALTLIILISGMALVTLAQSETPAKSTATPPASEKTTTSETLPPVTGTISGKVSASDGQPLMNVNVIVQSLSGVPVAKPTRPDADGKFVFEELTPGAYIVLGTAPGYIDQSFGLGNPLEWPRHILGSNVRINMIKGGVITGLVTSPKGEPMVGVPVNATQSGSTGSSMMTFLSGGGVSETDDRGVYRIYGLLPGQYTVQAGGKGAIGNFTASGFDMEVPTYYPSSTRDTAVPVSVRSGDETTGIDIRYRGAEGHSISGVVLGNIEASAMSGAVTIMLAHASTAAMVSLGIAGVADPRRAFSFNGVGDGEYDLVASYLVNPNENALIGTKRISVRGGDLTGIELRLAPLGSVSGTITLDPIKPEARCDKRRSQVMETILKLPNDDPKKVANQLTAMYAGLGQLNEKGEFAMRNLESSRYRLDIKLPTESWYVRAINLPASAARAVQTASTVKPAQPVLPEKPLQPTPATPAAWQGTLTIKSGDAISGVSITVGQDAAALRGRASSEGTTVREGTRVYMVPVDREQANNVLRYSDTLVKRDGTFAFANLAPGRYIILSRVDPPTESDTAPRPLAWDAAERAKLRREAETAKTEIELKPCQSIVDYQLKPASAQ